MVGPLCRYYRLLTATGVHSMAFFTLAVISACALFVTVGDSFIACGLIYCTCNYIFLMPCYIVNGFVYYMFIVFIDHPYKYATVASGVDVVSLIYFYAFNILLFDHKYIFLCLQKNTFILFPSCDNVNNYYYFFILFSFGRGVGNGWYCWKSQNSLTCSSFHCGFS